MDSRLELIEAGYRFDLPEAQQLALLLDVLARRLEPRRPLLAFTATLVDGRQHYRTIATAQADRGLPPAMFADPRSELTRDNFHVFYGVPGRHNVNSLLTARYRAMVAPLGLPEVVGLHCPDGHGTSLVLGTAWPEPQAMSAAERGFWAPVAHHLASGLRLRDRLGAAVDAVVRVDRGPRLEELAPVAGAAVDRAALLEAVRLRESSRSGRRASRGELWPDLVRGRWTLVDRFEEGGRRYALAIRNPRAGSAVRALTRRERFVLDRIARGEANKAIAIELGTSEATISRAARAALAKLGVGLAELLAVASASVEPLALGGVQLGMIGLGAPADPAVRLLSRCELLTVEGVLRGLANAQIARARNIAPRTVANQLASAYAKLGVRSRRELVLALAGAAL